MIVQIHYELDFDKLMFHCTNYINTLQYIVRVT